MSKTRRMTGIVYGRPKRGKSLGLLKAGAAGLCIGAGDGLDVADYLHLDLSDRWHKVRLVSDVVALIKKHQDKVPSIIIDDLTYIFDWTMEEMDRKHKKGGNAYAAADAFNDQVYELASTMLDAPCDVIASMHEQDPKDKVVTRGKGEGKVQKVVGVIAGTVQMPGWRWPEKFPGLFSFVAHIVHDPDFPGWPFVYQTGPDENWITGDRYNVTPPRCPQNLGEVWRAAGRAVPRPKGFEWMEPVVEKVAEQLFEGFQQEDFKIDEFLREKVRNISGLPKINPHPKHVRWALQDAIDRANLRRTQESLLDMFINSASTATNADI